MELIRKSNKFSLGNKVKNSKNPASLQSAVVYSFDESRNGNGSSRQNSNCKEPESEDSAESHSSTRPLESDSSDDEYETGESDPEPEEIHHVPKECDRNNERCKAKIASPFGHVIKPTAADEDFSDSSAEDSTSGEEEEKVSANLIPTNNCVNRNAERERISDNSSEATEDSQDSSSESDNDPISEDVETEQNSTSSCLSISKNNDTGSTKEPMGNRSTDDSDSYISSTSSSTAEACIETAPPPPPIPAETFLKLPLSDETKVSTSRNQSLTNCMSDIFAKIKNKEYTLRPVIRPSEDITNDNVVNNTDVKVVAPVKTEVLECNGNTPAKIQSASNKTMKHSGTPVALLQPEKYSKKQLEISYSRKNKIVPVLENGAEIREEEFDIGNLSLKELEEYELKLKLKLVQIRKQTLLQSKGVVNDPTVSSTQSQTIIFHPPKEYTPTSTNFFEKSLLSHGGYNSDVLQDDLEYQNRKQVREIVMEELLKRSYTLKPINQRRTRPSLSTHAKSKEEALKEALRNRLKAFTEDEGDSACCQESPSDWDEQSNVDDVFTQHTL